MKPQESKIKRNFHFPVNYHMGRDCLWCLLGKKSHIIIWEDTYAENLFKQHEMFLFTIFSFLTNFSFKGRVFFLIFVTLDILFCPTRGKIYNNKDLKYKYFSHTLPWNLHPCLMNNDKGPIPFREVSKISHKHKM